MSKNSTKSKNVEKKETKEKIELCDVLYIKDNKIAFNFKGHGIVCENKLNINSNKVKITYKSDIGKAGFNFDIIE